MKEHTIIRWKSRGSVTFIFPLLKNLKYKSNIETDACSLLLKKFFTKTHSLSSSLSFYLSLSLPLFLFSAQILLLMQVQSVHVLDSGFPF